MDIVNCWKCVENAMSKANFSSLFSPRLWQICWEWVGGGGEEQGWCLSANLRIGRERLGAPGSTISVAWGLAPDLLLSSICHLPCFLSFCLKVRWGYGSSCTLCTQERSCWHASCSTRSLFIFGQRSDLGSAVRALSAPALMQFLPSLHLPCSHLPLSHQLSNWLLK